MNNIAAGSRQIQTRSQLNYLALDLAQPLCILEDSMLLVHPHGDLWEFPSSNACTQQKIRHQGPLIGDRPQETTHRNPQSHDQQRCVQQPSPEECTLHLPRGDQTPPMFLSLVRVTSTRRQVSGTGRTRGILTSTQIAAKLHERLL